MVLFLMKGKTSIGKRLRQADSIGTVIMHNYKKRAAAKAARLHMFDQHQTGVWAFEKVASGAFSLMRERPTAF
jgi:hypothetical protein